MRKKKFITHSFYIIQIKSQRAEQREDHFTRHQVSLHTSFITQLNISFPREIITKSNYQSICNKKRLAIYLLKGEIVKSNLRKLLRDIYLETDEIFAKGDFGVVFESFLTIDTRSSVYHCETIAWSTKENYCKI